tara:strand:+ start:816 stop:1451 length:636 start_codon:yes stop_codon:yes gene_type:complete
MLSHNEFENFKVSVGDQLEVDSRTYEDQGMIVSLGHVKLDEGWVCIEPCECSYCVHYAVRAFGSEKDKKRFNESQTLGDSYHIPMTRKEKALYKKQKVKEKKLRPLKIKENGRYIRRELLAMRSQGINIYRRNKRTLHEGIVQYIGIKEHFENVIYLPAPANNASDSFVEVILSLDELEKSYIRLWEKSGVENAAFQAKVNLRKRQARLAG